MQIEKTAIVNESSIKTSQSRTSLITYDSEIFLGDFASLFSPEYWQSQNAMIGQAQGRGTTWFFKLADNEYVLRHYYRGGLMAKFLHDQYVCYHFSQARAYQEFYLLRKMHEDLLPVPRPVAFQVKRSGLFSRNDIITERIKNAKSLCEWLCSQAIDNSLWQQIGKTIRRFHNHAIYHHDLNINNILIDDKEHIWLIDFDQGECRNTGNTQWKSQNLARMQRSILKEKQRHSPFYAQEAQWQHVLKGYGD